MKIHLRNALAVSLGISALAAYADADSFRYDFSEAGLPLNTVGRSLASVGNGVFTSKDSYALFGAPDLKDYEFTFRARSPKANQPVQIWSGFRAANHHDRYKLGFRGGLQDDIILMRLGYLGTEEFLGEHPLRFHPEPGEWYDFRVQVCGNRIRVFVCDEKDPYIDIEDKNAYLIPSGGVLLGGEWIDTEFDDLSITPLAADALDGVAKKEYKKVISKKEKELRRKKERSQYSAVTVPL